MQDYLRFFRDHHIDPAAITRIDFVDLNCENFLLCMPNLCYLVWQRATLERDELAQVYTWHWFWMMFIIYAAFTRQVISASAISVL
jgi:hypothetical protein